jgi:hypothetical protein
LFWRAGVPARAPAVRAAARVGASRFADLRSLCALALAFLQ